MRTTRDLLLDGTHVGRIEVAVTFGARFRGLMLRRHLPEGLLLTPERSVHGMWMLAALDVAAIGADGLVLRTFVLRPWAFGPTTPGTRAVLEAPVGTFARWGLRTGSRVHVADPAGG